jgi:hypothetical protein
METGSAMNGWIRSENGAESSGSAMNRKKVATVDQQDGERWIR